MTILDSRDETARSLELDKTKCFGEVPATTHGQATVYLSVEVAFPPSLLALLRLRDAADA